MGVFSEAERDYLTQRRLARLATVGKDGMPHITPVGMWRLADDGDHIDVTGRDFAASKKFRDVAATGRAALVVDDLASTDPWHPRGVEIRGSAEALSDPEPRIRIHPERVVSWGIADQSSGGVQT